MSINFNSLETARDKAVVAVMNALPESMEDRAEEMVEAIVGLVFETLKQYLNEEIYDELSH